MDQNCCRHRNMFWAITKVIFNYTGSPGEIILLKVLGGYFFDSHCMFWFFSERRDPCFGHCVASVTWVGLIMEIALYCRSEARSGAERSDAKIEWSGAVSGRCRKTMERRGALSRGSRGGNGAVSGGYRIRLERGAAFLPAPLTCSAFQ